MPRRDQARVEARRAVVRDLLLIVLVWCGFIVMGVLHAGVS